MQNRLNRDYVKLKFALLESKTVFTKTKNGMYDAELLYDAEGPVLISVFTHAKDNAEQIHNITQEMTTTEKGWEGHFVCKEGKTVSHSVKDIRLDCEDQTIYSKDAASGVYPFIVRMVILRKFSTQTILNYPCSLTSLATQ